MSHVFISYVRENSEQVWRLVDVLRALQIEVWIDRESISPGERWRDAIRRAIQDGAFFIACFSAEYEARVKTHMNEELLLATEEIRLRPHDATWFIPIMFNETALPPRALGPGVTLADLQAIEMYPSWDAGVRSLLSVLQPTLGVVYGLLNALSDPSARARIAAADQLAKLGSLATPAFEKLRALLRDDNETVRAAAASALAAIGICDDALVIDLLRIAYEGGHPKYPRSHASRALAAMGSKAVPYLLEIAAGRNRRLAEAAFATLVEIGSESLPALYAATSAEGPRTAVAVRALARIASRRAP